MIATGTPHNVTLDNRRDFPNYGEIQEFVNAADGDKWDVFVPGFKFPLNKNKIYSIQRILGVILFDNGNHKLVVHLEHTHPNRSLTQTHIQHFIRKYKHLYKKLGRYQSLGPIRT